MTAAIACTAAALVLAGYAACAASVLPGHQRAACLHRALAIRALTAWTRLAILAVKAAWTLRHPVRHAQYLTARAFRRIPGRPGDGEPLDEDERRAFIAVVQCWKHPAPPERSRT